MARYFSGTLAIAGVVALGACAQAPAMNAAADIAAVNALRDGFTAAMNAGDAAAIGHHPAAAAARSAGRGRAGQMSAVAPWTGTANRSTGREHRRT